MTVKAEPRGINKKWMAVALTPRCPLSWGNQRIPDAYNEQSETEAELRRPNEQGAALRPCLF